MLQLSELMVVTDMSVLRRVNWHLTDLTFVTVGEGSALSESQSDINYGTVSHPQ